MKRVRATVTVSDLYTKRDRLWGYGYADLAELFGVKEQTVRQLVCGVSELKAGEVGSNGGKVARTRRAPRLDPGDLKAVIRMAVQLHPELLVPLVAAPGGLEKKT